jgi:hypothetical protein
MVSLGHLRLRHVQDTTIIYGTISGDMLVLVPYFGLWDWKASLRADRSLCKWLIPSYRGTASSVGLSPS